MSRGINAPQEQKQKCREQIFGTITRSLRGIGLSNCAHTSINIQRPSGKYQHSNSLTTKAVNPDWNSQYTRKWNDNNSLTWLPSNKHRCRAAIILSSQCTTLRTTELWTIIYWDDRWITTQQGQQPLIFTSSDIKPASRRSEKNETERPLHYSSLKDGIHPLPLKRKLKATLYKKHVYTTLWKVQETLSTIWN